MKSFKQYLAEEEVTINPENWVDGEAKVKLVGEDQFEMNGDLFTIRQTHKSPDDEKFGVTIMNVTDDRYKEVVIVTKDHDEDIWRAYAHEISEDALTRTDKDPRIAAAKVLSNIW